MWTWIISMIAFYAVGAVGTYFLNIRLVNGPVVSPLRVARNVVLWPLYLPMMLSVAWERM